MRALAEGSVEPGAGAGEPHGEGARRAAGDVGGLGGGEAVPGDEQEGFAFGPATAGQALQERLAFVDRGFRRGGVCRCGKAAHGLPPDVVGSDGQPAAAAQDVAGDDDQPGERVGWDGEASAPGDDEHLGNDVVAIGRRDVAADVGEDARGAGAVERLERRVVAAGGAAARSRYVAIVRRWWNTSTRRGSGGGGRHTCVCVAGGERWWVHT